MEFFQKISKILSSQTSLFVIVAAAIAFIEPLSFNWVKGNTQTIILGIIMLSMGMTLTVNDFKVLAKTPLDICIGAAAQYTVMPLLAYVVAKSLDLPAGIAVGLILVGCCPGGVSSNIMSFLCKGDVPYSIGMTTVSTLLAPLMTPLLVLLLAGQEISVNAVGMFKSIMIVTIAPITVGFLFNYFLGKTDVFKNLQQIMPGIAVIGLALIVGGVIAANGKSFFISGALIFLAIFLHNTIGYLIGYTVAALCRMGLPKKRTLSIEVGMQNAGLGTNLATIHFPLLPEAAVAAAVSCVWHSITGSILAGIYIKYDDWKAKSPKATTAKAAEPASE